MNVKHCLVISRVIALTQRICRRIARKLREVKNRAREKFIISETRKKNWVDKTLTKLIKRVSLMISFWLDVTEEQNALQSKARSMKKKRDDFVKKHFRKIWCIVWKRYQNSLRRTLSIAQSEVIDKRRLELHETLIKIESALTTQIRFEKINLTNFLFKQRVLSMTFSICLCEWSRQTSQHVIMNCDLQNYKSRLTMLKEISVHSYNALVEDTKRLKLATAWLMRTELLFQFSLAVQETHFSAHFST